MGFGCGLMPQYIECDGLVGKLEDGSFSEQRANSPQAAVYFLLSIQNTYPARVHTKWRVVAYFDGDKLRFDEVYYDTPFRRFRKCDRQTRTLEGTKVAHEMRRVITEFVEASFS